MIGTLSAFCMAHWIGKLRMIDYESEHLSHKDTLATCAKMNETSICFGDEGAIGQLDIIRNYLTFV